MQTGFYPVYGSFTAKDSNTALISSSIVRQPINTVGKSITSHPFSCIAMGGSYRLPCSIFPCLYLVCLIGKDQLVLVSKVIVYPGGCLVPLPIKGGICLDPSWSSSPYF